MRHTWRRDGKGEIDEYAFGHPATLNNNNQPHGPVCKICGFSFNINDGKEDYSADWNDENCSGPRVETENVETIEHTVSMDKLNALLHRRY